MDNLLELTADVTNGRYDGKTTMAAFLDISSVYNNIKRDILITKLLQVECPIQLVRFINY